MSSKLWSTLKNKLTKPLIGLGAVSVSTTLAACYGPPQGYIDNMKQSEEFCGKILANGCKDETGNFPYQCKEYCDYLKNQKDLGKEVEIPECCH
ncbi:MAG: hypothetical protein J6A01_03945 [Proteobacteria bacterium]|nr:hypothetical protein [Pseudomonadota bacterium]